MAATFAGKLSRERRERLLWRAAYEGELTTDNVMALLGVTRDAASQCLHRCVVAGVLVRTETGVYARARQVRS